MFKYRRFGSELRARVFIDVPQQQLIVATHSAFLLSIFNAVFTPADGEKPELTRWFGTGEMRAVIIRFA